MKRLLPLVALVISINGWAQQDPQFSQYMFNSFYYNPAFAGTEGVTKITGLYRAQWLGYSPTYGDGGAPTTQILSINTPVPKFKGGVGGYVVNDQLGPLTNFEAQASYAYYINMKDAKLSIGVRAGLISQTMNFEILRAVDPDDPLLAGKAGKETQMRPDFAAGLMFKKEKYYVGVGMDHLSQPTYTFGLPQSNQLKQHLYVTGSYYYDVNFDIRIQFVTLIKSDLTKTSFDVGGIAYFKDVMWGGLSFRQSEAAILILGYSLLKDKSLKVGYSLDYIIKDQQAKQPTSHELMVSYSLPVNLSGKKIIRTPRFRY
ncbi:MAG TPA: type IX secretion system membrane protein PorP/SprF [Cyclobacteriaceae bacterium]|nr:type IX secretion system membrane protein PorP/SprF [Cyclobacteriaceae bacterium]